MKQEEFVEEQQTPEVEDVQITDEYQEEPKSDDLHQEKSPPKEPTGIEIAKQMGWREGGPKSWHEFLLDSNSIIDHLKDRTKTQGDMISSMSKQIKDMSKAQAENLREVSENRIAKLQAQRDEAREDGDWEKIDRITEEINKTKAKAEAYRKQAEESNEEPRGEDGFTNSDRKSIDEYLQKNPWYHTEEDLKFIADGVFTRDAGKKPIQEILDEITKRVKQYAKQPEQPYRPPQRQSTTIHRGNPRPKSAQRVNFNDLSSDDQKMIRGMIDGGVYSDRKGTYEQRCQWYTDELVKSNAI